MKRFNRYAWALAIIVVLGFLIRLPQTIYGLPAARFPDSIKTVDVAYILANLWQRGIFRLDPGTYQYPTLYTNLLAACFMVFKHNGNSEFYGRLLSALSSTLAIVVIYGVGTRLRNRRTGLMAAVFASLGFFFALEGRHPTPDGLQAALICLSVLLLVPRDGKRTPINAAGFVMGLAIGTKYTALVYIFPILFVAILTLPLGTADKVKKALLSILLSVVGFLVATPSFLHHSAAYIDRLKIEREIQRMGDLNLMPQHIWDYLFSSASWGGQRPFPDSLSGVLGIPFVVMGLAAVVWLTIWSFQKKHWFEWSLCLSSIGAYFFFSIVSHIRGVRFLLPLAYLLTLIIAVVINDVEGFIAATKHRHKWASFRPVFLTVLLLALALAPNITISAQYLKVLQTPDTRLQAAAWIIQNVPPGKTILNFIHGPALPNDRYQMVTPRLPEYRVELESFTVSPLTPEDLDRLNIDYVIWNNFYFPAFPMLAHQKENDVVEKYWHEWFQLFYSLEQREKPQVPVTFRGAVTPTLRIFSRGKHSWAKHRA